MGLVNIDAISVGTHFKAMLTMIKSKLDAALSKCLCFCVYGLVLNWLIPAGGV